MISDLIRKNRSIRRFDHSVKIEAETIKKWIDLARLSSSGRNMQPLKYVICTDEKINSLIFPHLGWAGYLSDWKGPAEDERPVAYIVVLLDISLSETYNCDDGIAMQSIMLGATEDGYGSCIIGSVNKSRVGKILQLPVTMEVLWVMALGKPAEKVVLETAENGEIKYWRDNDEVHHVPKRPLDEIIHSIL
jgi:nitroreductase